jgi:hypothetical protein
MSTLVPTGLRSCLVDAMHYGRHQLCALIASGLQGNRPYLGQFGAMYTNKPLPMLALHGQAGCGIGRQLKQTGYRGFAPTATPILPVTLYRELQ